MTRKRTNRLGLAAAAGLMAAGAAGSPATADTGGDRLKQRDDDCPPAAAIAMPNLLDARKSGNESSASEGKPGLKAKPRKRSPVRKKTAKKTAKKAAKKAAKKTAGKRTFKKPAPRTRKKAAKRRTARRDPC
ncbi:MAG: hypothetical protein ACLFWF_09700 [Alphaproteobacteria bacterium]